MNFDSIAPFYGVMEKFLAGGCMQRARTGLLGGIQEPQRVLMVGEGNGRFLRYFHARFPSARITVVEQSEGMLKRAREQMGTSERVEYVCSDLMQWCADVRFDLIVTNFFLDCFIPQQLEEVIGKLASLSSSQSEWLIADFQIPAGGFRRWRSRFIVGLLYRFFGTVTGLEARALREPDDFLEHHGFERASRKEWSMGLLKSEYWRRRSLAAEGASVGSGA